MAKEKVTAIIPTFNEEVHIEEAIQSVSFADEIIIIDSFSTDNTIDLAEKYDVRILQRVFDDFSSQKNYAIDLAKHNWVYILDADERISKELQNEIKECLRNPNQKVGFYIHRTFYYHNKKIKYGGWQRDKVLRLFRKDKCRYNGALVHEIIEYDGEVGIMKNKIDHYSYSGFEHYENKLMHYATLRALSLYQKKKSATFFHLHIKPPVRFLIDYFLRLGIFDGKEGMILASHQYRGVKARYTKLIQLYKNENSSNEK